MTLPERQSFNLAMENLGTQPSFVASYLSRKWESRTGNITFHARPAPEQAWKIGWTVPDKDSTAGAARAYDLYDGITTYQKDCFIGGILYEGYRASIYNTGKAPRDKNTVLRETRAPYVAYSGLSKIISTRPILMPNVLEDKIRARDFARNAAKIDLFDPSYDPSGLSTRLQTSLYKNMPAAQEGVIYPVGFILQHCQGRYDQEEDIIYTQAALKENPSLEKDTVPSFLCTVTCMQPGSSFQIALKHAETTPEMLGMFHESLDDMTQLEKQFIDPAYEEDDKLCWAQRIMEKNFGPDPMHHSQARLNLTNLRCLPASTRTHATG